MQTTLDPGINSPGGPDIYDDIIKALEQNGEMTDDQFRRLVLFALVDLGRGRVQGRQCLEGIRKLNKSVEKLEKNSLLLLARNHPKITGMVLAFVVFFTITVISHLEMWNWIGRVIEEWLEVPLP